MILAAGLRWGPRVEQTCELCRPHPDEDEVEREQRMERRRLWGCDEPLERPTLQLDCPICPPRAPVRQCRQCGGSGQVRIYRCPNAEVDPVALEVCDAASMLEQGILPMPGGWLDQAATGWDAIKLALSERAAYEERAEEAARRRAERAQQRGR